MLDVSFDFFCARARSAFSLSSTRAAMRRLRSASLLRRRTGMARTLSLSFEPSSARDAEAPLGADFPRISRRRWLA